MLSVKWKQSNLISMLVVAVAVVSLTWCGNGAPDNPLDASVDGDLEQEDSATPDGGDADDLEPDAPDGSADADDLEPDSSDAEADAQDTDARDGSDHDDETPEDGGIVEPCDEDGLCDPGMYCARQRCDGPGFCVPQPLASCPEDETDEVCGCDGATYATMCHAAVAGVSVHRSAPCGDCGEGLGECGANEFCQFERGVCSDEVLPGICDDIPHATGCSDLSNYVCGCDGETYLNDCVRRQASMSLAHNGPCDCPPQPACDPGTFLWDTDDDGCVDSCLTTCPETIICDGTPCDGSEDCDATSFCDGRCGDLGSCSPRPDLETCPFLGRYTMPHEMFDPACGCDGRWYLNPCFAWINGVGAWGWGCPVTFECDPYLGVPCAEGEFCEISSESCSPSLPGEPAVCVEIPAVCPEEIHFVCGCDGVTYRNDCERLTARVGKLHPGTCDCDTAPCPDDLVGVDRNFDGCLDDCIPETCETNEACGRGFFCNGPTCDSEGTCVVQPENCIPVSGPVCGCDDITYNNECAAHSSGTRIFCNCPCDECDECPF